MKIQTIFLYKFLTESVMRYDPFFKTLYQKYIIPFALKLMNFLLAMGIVSHLNTTNSIMQ